MTAPRPIDPPLLVAVWFLLGLGVSASLLEVAPDAEATAMATAAALVAVATGIAVWRGVAASIPRLRAIFRVSAVAGALIAVSLVQRLWNALAAV